MTEPTTHVVVTDANVLINLIHVARLDLCAKLDGYEFVVPDHVREEVRQDVQRAALDEAVAAGAFRIESVTDPEAVASFAELTAFMGRGEAACLTLAERNDWTVLSDEKGRFRREVEQRLGRGRLIGTADIFVLAIRAGLLSVEEADADKAVLEGRRFRMPFGSFRERVAGDL